MTAISEPLPIQGLWIGNTLTNLEKLCIASFLANGHSFHLYSYDDVSEVPSGTIMMDASKILPASMIFEYREYKSHAGFSNYFRYKLLVDKGGWWTDLDMVCLKVLDFTSDYVFAAQQEIDLSETVTSGLIKAPVASTLMQHLFDACLSKDPGQITWGETGPHLLHAAVSEFSLERYVQHTNVFCPIPFYRWTDLIRPREHSEFDETIRTIHFWNEMWRRNNFDKNKVYSPSSVFEQLKKRYI